MWTEGEILTGEGKVSINVDMDGKPCEIFHVKKEMKGCEKNFK